MEPVDWMEQENKRLTAELEQIRAKAAAQGKYACEMFDECKRAQLAERDATKRAETAEAKNAELTEEINYRELLALEFGYRQCEKHLNIETTFSKFKAMFKEREKP